MRDSCFSRGCLRNAAVLLAGFGLCAACGDGPDASQPPYAQLSVKICAGNSFGVTTTPDPEFGDAVAYDCMPCPDTWQDCAVDGPDGDNHLIYFVVDEMGGRLQITKERGDRLVLRHTSGTGVSSSLTLSEGDRELLGKGVQVVTLAWEPGFVCTTCGLPPGFPNAEALVSFGWLTRKERRPSTLPLQNRRVAAAIKWVHDHLAEGRPFGTIGGSGGATATFMATYWNGIGDFIDYQYLSGGPVGWDINVVCGGAPPEPGVCENDPLRDCSADSQCGTIDDRCAGNSAAPTTPPANLVRRWIDYVHASHDCTEGVFNAAFNDSSYRYTAGYVHNRHFIDFVINENQDPVARVFGDTGLGITGPAARAYRLMQGPKRWTDNDGYVHGSPPPGQLVTMVGTGLR